MIQINIQSNLAQVQRSLDRFTKELQSKAIVRALNNTATSAKVEASRDIRAAGYNIKAKRVKQAIEVRRATAADLQAIVTATGKAIPRLAFGARQTAAGVSYSIKGGRTMKAGAFIATMKSGHTGAFMRVAGFQTGKRGTPILNRKIRELWGPSIPTVLMNKVVHVRLEQALRDRFPKELERQIRFIGLPKK